MVLETPMKTILLTRKVFTSNSTIGDLVFEDFGCWVLEPPLHGNLVCIPPGIYKIEWRWSPAHKRFVPGLLDVPGRTDIEIHPGNFEGSKNQNGVVKFDSKGCLLPGENHGVDFVSNSGNTCNKLFPLIEQACKEGDLFIDVRGGDL